MDLTINGRVGRTVLCKVTLLVFVLLSTVVHAASEPSPLDVSHYRQPVLRIPEANTSFVIDGKPLQQEIAACAEVRQLISFNVAARGDSRTRVWLAHRGTDLYVAFDIRTPPDKVRAIARDRDDSALWQKDDVIELRIVVGDRTYDFTGNANGASGDMLYHPDDSLWSAKGWRYAATRHDDGWSGEFLFSASVFGVTRFTAGMAWQMDVCNNAKSTSITNWAYQAGKWNASSLHWPSIVFSDRSGVYQSQQQLGDLGKDQIGLLATLANPSGRQQQVEVEASFYRVKPGIESFSYYAQLHGMLANTGVELKPGLTRKQLLKHIVNQILGNYYCALKIQKTIRIAPNATSAIHLRKPKFQGTYLVSYRFVDHASGQVIASGVYPFGMMPALKTSFEYYYLMAKQLVIKTSVPPMIAQQAQSLSCQILVGDEDRVIAQTLLQPVRAGEMIAQLSTADWAAGSYRLRVQALDSSGKVLLQRITPFEKPKTPFWWNSGAGDEIKVSWPWTAVKANAQQVTVWGRTYHWKNSFLPTQIVSQGRDLLAKPIRLSTRVDGRKVSWQVDRFELDHQEPAQASYTFKAHVEKLRLQGKISVSFDGMMRIDAELTSDAPKGHAPTVNEFFLDIPMTPKHARMFGRARNLGVQPLEETPSSWSNQYPETGFVTDEPFHFPFTPSFVLRNDNVGLEWFAEEDWDWSNQSKTRKLEIISTEDQVLLRVRLIDQATQIDRPRSFTFGLEAWPVKPASKKQFNITNHVGPPPKTGSWHKEIYEWDQYLPQAAKLGLNVLWYFGWNMDDTVGPFAPGYPFLTTEKVRKRIQHAGQISQKNGMAVIGHDGYGMPTLVPDYKYYGMEMARLPLINIGSYGIKVSPTKPFIDAFAARYKKLAQNQQWGGLMLDGLYEPMYTANWRAGLARRNAQGEIQGKYPIFAYRELARRLYNVFHGEVLLPGTKYGFIYNHIQHLIGPIHAFVDANVSGEHRRSMMVKHLRDMDLDLERATYAVRSFGPPLHWLPKEGRAPVGNIGRIAFALQLDMNMPAQRFLTHLDENNYERRSYPMHRIWAARQWIKAGSHNFYGYWNNSQFVKLSQPDFYASLYLLPSKRVLLAVSNWGKGKRSVQANLNLKAMGFKVDQLKAVDAITQATLKMEHGVLQMQVVEDGYRLIKISVP